MSKYSKIIVGGCSWTEKDYPKFAKPKPLNFKMWGELIGEKLNCEVINTAKGGYGNKAIYHQTLKAIMNNKVDHVFVMWSEWTRQDFLLDTLNDTEYVNIPTWNIDKESTISNEVINNWYNDTFNKNFPKKHKSNPRHINVAPIPSMKQLVNTNINYIYSLEVICEKLNIKYTTCQAIDTCILPILIIKHPHLEHIKNFHGWPPTKDLGGFTMSNLLKKEYGLDFKISDTDAHPNEIGQKFIADKMLEYANV